MTRHRRVVVGHDTNGASIIAGDRLIEETVLAPRGNRLAVLWGRDDVADLPAPVDAASPAGFLPPPSGWRAALLTFAPDDSPMLPAGHGAVLADLGRQMQQGGGRGMHTTASVDVVLVISGELWLEVDDGAEVLLTAGDTVVQNGTRHAWRNKSSDPATIALFMVGAHHADA